MFKEGVDVVLTTFMLLVTIKPNGHELFIKYLEAAWRRAELAGASAFTYRDAPAADDC